LSEEDFIARIEAILAHHDDDRRTEAPPFIFEMTDEAATHNTKVLETYNFDFQKMLASQTRTPLGVGSEFRRPEILEPLLCRHPLWDHLKEMLMHGAILPLEEMTDTDRQEDIEFHLQRGNHKSCVTHCDLARTLLLDDVVHGFSLPLQADCVTKIPKASLAPLGVQFQKTVDETGKTVPKYRITHDQTFQGPTGKSVNVRTQKDKLPPCVYGRVLLRLTHYIVDMRAKHPGKRILLGKYDLKAAYRRAHLSGPSIAECLTIFEDRLYASLRFTFGGTPFPYLWSVHSEILGDLANDLIQCNAWDHKTLKSPLQELLPAPLRTDSDAPFAAAKPMAVTMPQNDRGIVDVYLDDLPPVCVDINDNAERCAAAVPLAIHIMGRPVEPSEPIPRDELLSIKKTLGEGQMAETRIVLGWSFNTRNLTIELPPEKHFNWLQDLDNHTSMRTVEVEKLDTTVGRLNHVGIILPPSRHFISRLRSLVEFSKRKNRRWVRLPRRVKDDINLFKEILTITLGGISMNNIVFRTPTHVYRSDASSLGLGGHNLATGAAWRFKLPPDILQSVTLNTLEFIGCLITLWIDITHGRTPPESCILSQTDSTSADGWLYKSNFDPSSAKTQLTVARKLASIIIKADCCLYSQWFPGELNVVSDILSRRFDLTDDELVSFVLHTCPSQVPSGIKILSLPTEIDCWLTCLLLTARSSPPSPDKPPIKTGEPGDDGLPTSPMWDWDRTHFSRDCPAPSVTESSAPSPRPSETQDSALPASISSLLESSRPPSLMWRRPFGLTTGRTHDSTQTEKWRSFYSAK
jgi:hypothetical protein